ncbi:thymidylate synthase [Rheinheimera gaetbuli]
MLLTGDTLDDLLMDLYDALLNSAYEETSTKGSYLEISGCLLKLTNPLARLSRSETKGTLYSCLGELLWYLAGTNDSSFITYYIDYYKNFVEADNRIHGGYGPRLSKMHGEFDQIEQVITMLRNKPTSRQAVIQLFDAYDISQPFKDIPCTLSLQFLIRNGKLDMFVMMRSNDAYRGLPHDVFVFTMLQEIIARKLDIELGTYTHFVTSMHLYKDDSIVKARQFMQEGFMSSEAVMPPIPAKNFEQNINAVVMLEKEIREGNFSPSKVVALESYWEDLVNLLYIFSIKKNTSLSRVRRLELISEIETSIKNPQYIKYVQKIKSVLRKRTR